MKKILLKILISYIILILIYIVHSTIIVIKYDIEEGGGNNGKRAESIETRGLNFGTTSS